VRKDIDRCGRTFISFNRKIFFQSLFIVNRSVGHNAVLWMGIKHRKANSSFSLLQNRPRGRWPINDATRAFASRWPTNAESSYNRHYAVNVSLNGFPRSAWCRHLFENSPFKPKPTFTRAESERALKWTKLAQERRMYPQSNSFTVAHR